MIPLPSIPLPMIFPSASAVDPQVLDRAVSARPASGICCPGVPHEHLPMRTR